MGALAAGAAAVPQTGAAATSEQVLNFDAPVPGTLSGSGFSSALGGNHAPGQLSVTGGALEVTTTGGDLLQNAQDNALQTTFDGSSSYRVTTVLRGPVGVDTPFQGAGIVLGPNQNNYVKFVAGVGPGGQVRLELASEIGGQFSSNNFGLPAGALDADHIVLSLEVDVDAGTITARYKPAGGITSAPGSIPLPGFLGSSTDKAGIVTTHYDGNSNPADDQPVTFAFDTFLIEPFAGINFEAKEDVVTGANAPGLQLPTSLAIGPDGRLYVAQQNGKIHVFDLDANNDPTFLRVIEDVFDYPNFKFDGTTPKNATGRQVTGIAFDPDSPANAPVLYVSHSDPEIFVNQEPGQNSISPSSGMLTELTLDAGAVVSSKRDLVTGLPRSAENHGPNGMAFGPDGWLYLSIGGNTNHGAPSLFFSYYPETELSGTVVKVDPNAIGATPVDATNGSRFEWLDPCVGNESVGNGCSAASSQTSFPGDGTVPGKLELHATGFRNGYDIAWHSNGKLYLNENEGNGGLGLTPPGDDGGCAAFTPVDPGTPNDELVLVEANGFHGHPAPVRGECQRDAGTGYLGQPFSAPIAEYTPTQTSTTGIAEYTADNFGDLLKGQLISTNFANGDNLVRVKLSANGSAVSELDELATGFTDPLDVIVAANGDLLVAEHGGFPGKVSRLRPIAASGACSPFDPTGDGDADGYTDADEVANGTSRCNPADAPPDLDGDNVSDLLDPDDDGDGTPDLADQLQRDASNGANTTLPFVQLFDTSDAGGFFGTGLEGAQLSSNGLGPLRELDGTTLVGAGIAGGFLQITAVDGTAAGARNDQANALQQGFDPGNGFSVSTVLGAPFGTGIPSSDASAGVHFGPGEDDFVRLVVSANGGNPRLELGREEAGNHVVSATAPLSLPIDHVDLELVGDPVANTVSAKYRLADGPLQTLATVPVPGSWFDMPALGGLMATSDSATTQGFGFEEFRISPAAATPPDPTAVAAPASLGFGDHPLPAGPTAPQTVTVQNAGAQDLLPGAPTLVGANPGQFAIVGESCQGDTLGTGASCSVDVVFDPSSNGAKTATLRIPSNDPSGPLDVPLTGVGGDGTPPALTGSVPADGATDVDVATSEITLTFSEAVTNVDAGDFSLTNGAAVPISAATLSQDGTEATVSLGGALSPGADHTLTISGDIADTSGNPLPETTVEFRTAAPPADGPIQMQSGTVVIEAEDADGSIARDGHEWLTGQAPAGSVGDAVSALPDSGSIVNTGYVGTVAERQYEVQFEAPGTYHVWVRGYATDNFGDSIHVGLNGQAQASADRMSYLPLNTWSWFDSTMDDVEATIVVPSAGVHTLNLWMREDGMSVDRLLVTDDAGLSPSGNGPPASPRGAPVSDTTPPTITDRTPAAGATNVALSTTVTAGFDEPLDPASVTPARATITPTAGGAPVDAQVDLAPGDTIVRIDPDAPLAESTEYQVAIGAQITDAAGNPLGQVDTWTFTTQGPAGSGPIQMQNGTVVIEAEDSDDNIARAGHEWLVGQAPAGAVGEAITASPDSGTNANTGYVGTVAERQYQVQFEAAGTYYVWARGYATDFGGDSIHVGLNGQAQASADRMSYLPLDSWSWFNETMDDVIATIEVPSAGVHTLNLWMREDGMSVDRLLLTDDAGLSPSGNGPPASLRSS